MFEEFKRIFRHSLIYGLGAFLSRAVAFIMIPIYTRYLTTRDYGIIELVALSADIAGMIIGMGIRDAVLRYYFDTESIKEKNRVISTGIIYTAVLGGVATLLIALFSEPLSHAIFGHGRHSLLLQMAMIANYLDLMTMICMTFYRAGERSGLYSTVIVCRLILSLGLNIILVVVFRLGVIGILTGTLVSTTLIAIYCLTGTLRSVGLGFSFNLTKSLIRYGLPLVPASFAMFSLQFADRFFLRHFSTVETVGVYSLAYKFGMALSFFLTEPFLLSWGALMFPISLREDAFEIYSRIMTYFMVICGLFGLGLALLGPGIIQLMTTPPFYPAGNAIPVLTLGFVMLSSSYIFNTGILIKKITVYRAISVICAAVVNLGMNRYLIPRYGMMGAAWATTVSFGVLAITAWYLSQRIYPIAYDFRRMAIIALVAAGIYWVAQLFSPERLVLSIVFRLLLILCFPVILYLVRFFSKQELQAARQGARSLKTRGMAFYRVVASARR